MKVSKHTQNKQPPANHQVITPTANFSTDPAGAQCQTGRGHVFKLGLLRRRAHCTAKHYLSAWCVYCGEHIAPPAAMASGMVSTTAFVVNLPMLRPGTILHEALVADGFPVDTSLDVSTWFEEVTSLTHRDLPEFVPITSTATEELTEHTKMRVNQRVYIINDVAMPSQFHLPFVIH